MSEKTAIVAFLWVTSLVITGFAVRCIPTARETTPLHTESENTTPTAADTPMTHNQEKSDDVPTAPTTIRLYGRWVKHDSEVLPISIYVSSTGRLRDMDGYRIDDDWLYDWRHSSGEEFPLPQRVRLHFEDDPTMTVSFLISTIHRIRRAANPRQELHLDVHLKGLDSKSLR